MDFKQIFTSMAIIICIAAAFCFGALSGYVARPFLQSMEGVASLDEKAPICFLAVMRQYNSNRHLTCWLNAEWSTRHEAWLVSSGSTARPDGRNQVNFSSVIAAGLRSEADYFRVYDSAGRFVGWFSLSTDQSGIGIDKPVGAIPRGNVPSGMGPRGSQPKGAIGKAPADA